MAKWVDFREVKAKVPIEAVLDFYGILEGMKRRGHKLSSPCPIHHGSSKNSFHVDTEKNVWNCFSKCKRGGNVIDLVMLLEGVEFREAALLLQERHMGDSAPTERRTADDATAKDTKRAKKEESKRSLAEEKRIEEAEGAGQENKPLTFELKLDRKHPYLKERGLEEETIKYFGLGACRRGVMKGRIAVPIRNVAGELVAYAGRLVPGAVPPDDEEEPKYRLPAAFRKALEVFNLHSVKRLQTDHKGSERPPVILVEGFFDCFMVHQAGFPYVVALMGSAMTKEQEELLLPASDKFVLMFDEDQAGHICRRDVAQRLVNRAFIRIVRFKEYGSQPDKLSSEVIRELLA